MSGPTVRFSAAAAICLLLITAVLTACGAPLPTSPGSGDAPVTEPTLLPPPPPVSTPSPPERTAPPRPTQSVEEMVAEREAYRRAQQEAGCDAEGTFPEMREFNLTWAFLSEAQGQGDAEGIAAWQARRDEVVERVRERCPGGYSYRPGRGPETMGWAILLPSDAYIGAGPERRLILCVDYGTDDAPACITDGYVLQRGQSSIAFNDKDGGLYGLHLAPGEHQAFAFLDGVIDWRPPGAVPSDDVSVEGVLLRSGEIRWTIGASRE